MDPISQGALGGALSQSIANKHNIARITLVGCLAGMAPDLDVLIQSDTDPILFLEFHRQIQIKFWRYIKFLFVYK